MKKIFHKIKTYKRNSIMMIILSTKIKINKKIMKKIKNFTSNYIQ